MVTTPMRGTTRPQSIDFGTSSLPTSPMAYKNVPKKIR
jgi:hypothetical protein